MAECQFVGQVQSKMQPIATRYDYNIQDSLMADESKQ